MKIPLLAFLILALPASRLGDNNDNLPINKIQVIGSHNSYKEAIDPALFKAFQQQNPESAEKIDYEHIDLTDQLNMGLLNLEIDVYADSKGGKYAHPKGLDWVKGQPSFDPEGEMKKPGFKVFHIVDLDFRSHCLTFKDGLKQLKAWSDAHPDHNPIFITLEPKDGKPKDPKLTVPEKFTTQTLAELDQDIKDGLGNSIITPDMVRGKYATLESAVLHGNWPTLKEAKGKFVFIMDNNKEDRALYIEGHPSLKGRVLFTNTDPGNPEAAMMIRNNPQDPEIKELVKKGYIIRTRADSDTEQARANDKTDFTAACNSGAQIITTDYYLKSTHFKSDYVVYFADGNKYFRLNPAFNPHNAPGNTTGK
ncbi:phosphatidylinositol-specific phospholipase C1-like protein [Mucilaginibacter sabulilitoris]|uniref:Phosphatidylinositol-specific phospholipase C1-like protein n=1 Tax=Mucilaginibacter sabulilitoris TaxID=1173583 RepID=A0ABZ0TEM1_9SPHI|nr:phosphatidylinositol-specific phospholipase C1-like protein [Mucilaginibacter sabulilitoris]WPU91422.1 phosphatidylinositol-specific phospholipase C1-like protein [Mucilaginibacter sabulilitoris]